jgi:hypothetical protein
MFFEQDSHLPLYIGMARYYLDLLKTTPRADDASTWHLRGNIALEIMDRHLERNHWFAGKERSCLRNQPSRICARRRTSSA